MGIFSHKDGDDASKTVCPSHDLSEQATHPAVGDMTFHRFNVILSGAAAAFAILVIFLFKMMHSTHFSNPKQQGNIMRIALLIPIFALISWLSLAFPVAYVYINPWIDVVEAWSLCSFFLLLCEYMAPSEQERNAFLATKNIPGKKGVMQGHKWFQMQWVLVFQYPVIAFLVAIFTDITQAAVVYCMFGKGIHFARFWLHLFIFKHLKPELAVHNAMMKFIAFKLVIFLTFIQNIVFWILESRTSVLNPSSTLTWTDLHVGIPNMLPCLEMVPLSLFFVWAYPWSPYSNSHGQHAESGGAPVRYQGGFLGYRAFFEMLNPSELIHGIIFACKILIGKGRD
ncbi:hypothetical protein NLU13_6558 [Sarocladium strictum]|uniref:DUF300-domain-containing protein n=1 Tax=Sarocladium strictum TaxID=5046 RepID=A0AA39GG47_SARSR|nr:hypothetical protein NLU13_6558 [Sarocladium strictum]